MRLLRGRWKKVFEKHAPAIRKLDRSLQSHRHYLTAKFKLLSPEIAELEKKGVHFVRCWSCRMESMRTFDSPAPLRRMKCMLCGYARNSIWLKCPGCGKDEVECEDGSGTCGSCDASIAFDFLVDQYGPAIAYCPECSSGEECVVEFWDRYLCLRCSNEFGQVGTCEWCNSEVAEDVTDSYLSGCCMCDGMIGWHRDD